MSFIPHSFRQSKFSESREHRLMFRVPGETPLSPEQARAKAERLVDATKALELAHKVGPAADIEDHKERVTNATAKMLGRGETYEDLQQWKIAKTYESRYPGLHFGFEAGELIVTMGPKATKKTLQLAQAQLLREMVNLKKEQKIVLKFRAKDFDETEEEYAAKKADEEASIRRNLGMRGKGEVAPEAQQQVYSDIFTAITKSLARIEAMEQARKNPAMIRALTREMVDTNPKEYIALITKESREDPTLLVDALKKEFIDDEMLIKIVTENIKSNVDLLRSFPKNRDTIDAYRKIVSTAPAGKKLMLIVTEEYDMVWVNDKATYSDAVRRSINEDPSLFFGVDWYREGMTVPLAPFATLKPEQKVALLSTLTTGKNIQMLDRLYGGAGFVIRDLLNDYPGGNMDIEVLLATLRNPVAMEYLQSEDQLFKLQMKKVLVSRLDQDVVKEYLYENTARDLEIQAALLSSLTNVQSVLTYAPRLLTLIMPELLESNKNLILQACIGVDADLNDSLRYLPRKWREDPYIAMYLIDAKPESYDDMPEGIRDNNLTASIALAKNPDRNPVTKSAHELIKKNLRPEHAKIFGEESPYAEKILGKFIADDDVTKNPYDVIWKEKPEVYEEMIRQIVAHNPALYFMAWDIEKNTTRFRKEIITRDWLVNQTDTFKVKFFNSIQNGWQIDMLSNSYANTPLLIQDMVSLNPNTDVLMAYVDNPLLRMEVQGTYPAFNEKTVRTLLMDRLGDKKVRAFVFNWMSSSPAVQEAVLKLPGYMKLLLQESPKSLRDIDITLLTAKKDEIVEMLLSDKSIPVEAYESLPDAWKNDVSLAILLCLHRPEMFYRLSPALQAKPLVQLCVTVFIGRTLGRDEFTTDIKKIGVALQESDFAELRGLPYADRVYSALRDNVSYIIAYCPAFKPDWLPALPAVTRPVPTPAAKKPAPAPKPGPVIDVPPVIPPRRSSDPLPPTGSTPSVRPPRSK